MAKTGFEPWAKSVEAASNGSIKVAFFPAQQLGKAADHYDMARDGIADMTWVNPGYQAGRFPMIAAGELPFLISKPGPGSAALDKWYRNYAVASIVLATLEGMAPQLPKASVDLGQIRKEFHHAVRQERQQEGKKARKK